MKKAGVVLEPWKLPIFKRHLDAAGYSYTELPGPISGSVALMVQYEWVHQLKPIIDAAQGECRLKKP